MIVTLRTFTMNQAMDWVIYTHCHLVLSIMESCDGGIIAISVLQIRGLRFKRLRKLPRSKQG